MSVEETKAIESEETAPAKPAVPERREPEPQPGIVKEFLIFLKERKLLWLSPIILILVLLSVFIFLTEGSALVPFIYAIF